MTEFDSRAGYLELLSTCIEGFEDLDIVLELTRVDAHADTLSALSADLHLSETQITGALERLCRSGLVLANTDGRYGIDASDPSRANALRQLRIEYESDR